jgi:hypothetical protein
VVPSSDTRSCDVCALSSSFTLQPAGNCIPLSLPFTFTLFLFLPSHSLHFSIYLSTQPPPTFTSPPRPHLFVMSRLSPPLLTTKHTTSPQPHRISLVQRLLRNLQLTHSNMHAVSLITLFITLLHLAVAIPAPHAGSELIDGDNYVPVQAYRQGHDLEAQAPGIVQR